MYIGYSSLSFIDIQVIEMPMLPTVLMYVSWSPLSFLNYTLYTMPLFTNVRYNVSRK